MYCLAGPLHTQWANILQCSIAKFFQVIQSCLKILAESFNEARDTADVLNEDDENGNTLPDNIPAPEDSHTLQGLGQCEKCLDCYYISIQLIWQLVKDPFRPLKTWLCSSMNQIRFNNLATLMIHSDRTLTWTTFL